MILQYFSFSIRSAFFKKQSSDIIMHNIFFVKFNMNVTFYVKCFSRIASHS